MDLCKRMVRTRVKGNGSKAASSPSTEPNFYAMEPCREEIFPRSNIIVPDAKPSPRRIGHRAESIMTPLEMGDLVPIQLAPLLVEDHDDGVLFFDNTDQDEEIVLKLMEGPNNKEIIRTESWSSLPQVSPSALITSVISSTSSLAAIVSPPDLLKHMVSPTRSLGDDLFVPVMTIPNVKEYEFFFDAEQPFCNSEALHSGDEVFFEGLPFHYLETKDMEDSLFVVGV